ncbi:MAG: assimilatory nitrite reductase [NAD(P)H] small subunit [Anoxybacillus sp.]|jgi:nitrite reductase (NADH) small subunit|uniref:Nitrite reductase (NAD(P)H) small subunit n=2 Tax=Anoxybacillus TaxID=150247 RepID=A0A178TSG9_9BACL|nr:MULTISPECIES: nitrite reductase small subunit NirD [Anoxybacillus]QAV27712.1 nitrite reductase (NAD(P)H) small subunit [Neobacillus thermocopriae]GIW49982.1 MAG: assimilatory nitrite reductase [NAD(P)H] small subunit [Anoxybacillus sp.]MBE2941197.1 nitrite reductase small subunit NirD [Anoxybacillus flavithermus]MBE2943843.1 nitrite reductase small subunit NirD [Anoxybacillus flavithermus]MBE2952114.1 nitrite reductase small subunit NirD [Anoxybacillus flavithermus]
MNKTVTRVLVAKYDELPVRVGQAIKIGEHEIALFRLSNGDVRALENKSPHPKGGVLSEGLVSGEYVFCPLYDWKISLIDGKVQEPDQGQVKTYQVEIDGDHVYIVF